MLIGIMKAWREKLAHEQMTQVSGTRGLCAEQREGRGTGRALIVGTRESRGRNVVEL